MYHAPLGCKMQIHKTAEKCFTYINIVQFQHKDIPNPTIILVLVVDSLDCVVPYDERPLASKIFGGLTAARFMTLGRLRPISTPRPPTSNSRARAPSQAATRTLYAFLPVSRVSSLSGQPLHAAVSSLKQEPTEVLQPESTR